MVQPGVAYLRRWLREAPVALPATPIFLDDVLTNAVEESSRSFRIANRLFFSLEKASQGLLDDVIDIRTREPKPEADPEPQFAPQDIEIVSG
jgi:hypothetical protein